MQGRQKARQMRHFFGAMHQQRARIAFGQAEHASGNRSRHAAEQVAAANVPAAHPEARAHFATPSHGADMVGKIADVDRRIAKADAGTNDGGLAIVVKAVIAETQQARRHKADRTTDQCTADIFVNQRRLPDVKRPAGRAGWRRFLPPDMDMRLRVPKLVFGGIITVPAKPPVDHGRGDTGHWRVHADPHAAVAGQHIAVLEHRRAAEQICRRVLKPWQQHVGNTATIERGADMGCQRRHCRIEEARECSGLFVLTIAQIAPGQCLAGDHATRPI